MSIKDACRLGASLTTGLPKERCISLVARGRSFHATHKHDWQVWAPLNLRNILLQNEFVKNTKPIAQIQSHQNPTL
jgi:hypothetical protein